MTIIRRKPEELCAYAISRINELGLEPTPQHYSIFYSYFSGTNGELTMGVDQAIEKGEHNPGKITDALIWVYDKYISEITRDSKTGDVALSMEAQLKQIAQLVSGASTQASDYGTALESFNQNITGEVTVERLQAAVSQMAQQTQNLVEQNQKLQGQLQDSTNQVQELRSNLDTVKKESLIDALTGIGNRKAFSSELQRATDEVREQQGALSLLMIDIDFFKKFNDKHGHLVGDQVLKLVARTLFENLKGRDMVARWGGEEFGILLPYTRVKDAIRVGESLCRTMAGKKIIRRPQNEDLGVVTLSIGATEYVYGEDLQMFVERADSALYQAKHNGRNRVEAAAPTGAETPAA